MVLQKIPKRRFDHPCGSVAVVLADFHKAIADGLLKGFEQEMKRYKGVKLQVYRTTGAFEIPLLAQRLAKKKAADVIVALGCIVKGDTYHFELIANECARGCMEVMLQESIPVVFEVLAVYGQKDAVERSTVQQNHGILAAHAALEWLEKLNR